jgi:hypothetical protein
VRLNFGQLGEPSGYHIPYQHINSDTSPMPHQNSQINLLLLRHLQTSNHGLHASATDNSYDGNLTGPFGFVDDLFGVLGLGKHYVLFVSAHYDFM